MRYLCMLLLGIPFAALAQTPGEAALPPASAAASSTPAEKPVEVVAEEILKSMEAYWAEEPAAEAPNALALDIHQCVDTALTQNAQVLVAQDNVDAAREKTGQAKAQWRPQVKGQIAYTYIDGLKPISFGGVLGSLMGGGGGFDSFQGKKDQRHDSLGITQVIYAGGQISAAVKASKYLAESQEWQKQAKLNDLEFETKKAYYDCLLTRAMVRVAEEAVVTFKRHLGDAQQMLDVGLISNFEVLRAKTEVGAREADTVAAKNLVRLALLNLRRILALPEDKEVRPIGKIEWTPVSETVDDLLKLAADKRPELLALQKGIDAAGQNVRRVRGEYLPKAAATANWSNNDNSGSAQPDGWTLGAGVQWDIYAGGRRKHELAEAKAQQSGLQHQMADVRRLIELDVRAAHLQMEDAVARMQQEKGTVELAREGRRLAQLRFQEGVGTQTETLDATLALTNAETMLVKAIHDCAVAHAAIEKAVARSWNRKGEG